MVREAEGDAALGASRPPAEEPVDEGLTRTGAALAVAVTLVQLPLTLVLGSRDEFHFGLWQLLPFWLGLAGVSWCLLLAPARLRGVRARGLLGPLYWALAVWAWVSGNLLVFDFGVLDGSPLAFGDKKLWAAPELLLALALLTAGFLWARRRPRAAGRLALAGLVLIAVQTAAALTLDLPRRGALTPVRPPSLARFAPADNVLVVLLDTFQGGVFSELVAESEPLASSFDGFVVFANALGVARTTALTMPAVHTGLRYEAGWTLDEYMKRARQRASFLGQAARAGAEVTVVNPFGFCPPQGAWCGELERLVGSPWRRLAAEALLPVDLALFRVAPLVAKRPLYGRGRWLTLRWLGVHQGSEQQEQSLGFLRQLAEDAHVEEGAPAVKFLHLPTPHSPLVADDRCNLGDEDLPKTRDNVRAQSRCALLAVAGLLDRLRDLGILESTLVVVMADHGAGLPLAAADPRLPLVWRERMGAANPLLAVRFPGAGSGPMTVSQQPVQIDDVGKTVCDAVRDCGYGVGRPLSFRGGPWRTRRYLDYTWRTDFWYRRGRIAVTEWQVRGPLRKRTSWSLVQAEGAAAAKSRAPDRGRSDRAAPPRS